MTVTYRTVPPASVFVRDSSVLLAVRNDDIILKHIDWLLKCYEQYKTTVVLKRPVILCDLFLTCNYWIKSFHERNPRMKKERYPAVLALFEAVVNQLTLTVQCTRAQLAEVIGEIYGREMDMHGVNMDDFRKEAKYFSRMERQIYRLRFKGGLAYQYQWYLEKPIMTLVAANSSNAYNPEVDRGGSNGASVNFGGFVMTMEREVFMAKHAIVGACSRLGVFHSSYTAGDRVIMAGTMLIESGVIKAIRSDSGHYHPTQQNMAALLQGLAMFGVDLRPIRLVNFDGTPLGTAREFLSSRMTWEQFKKQLFEERSDRIETDDARFKRGMAPKFPHLKNRGPLPSVAPPSAPGVYERSDQVAANL